VQVSCHREGRSSDLVTARTTGGGAATSVLDVICEPLAPARAAPAIVAPLALLPALPPAPVPVTPGQPALNPQAQLQVQAQAQPQVQLGLQEDEQLAPVAVLAREDPVQAESLRIEPLSRRDDVPPPAYLLGLVTVTAAAAVVVRRRSHVPVPVQVRRSR
jgi:hypothetical protein